MLKLIIALAFALTLFNGTTASAAPGDKAALRVAVAPLSTLGAEATSAAARAISNSLSQGLSRQAGVVVIEQRQIDAAIKSAKKPGLRTCDNEPKCLAELGALVGADQIIFGEVGGIGETSMVYLTLVSVRDAREVRATTLPIAAGSKTASDSETAAAIVRLLFPTRYVGKLNLIVDVERAQIFVDGQRIGYSPLPPHALSVGTHAVRVTHPEYRDFVRFVEVTYNDTTDLTAALLQFPVITSAVGELPRGPVTTINELPPRWYRRWWFVAGVGVLAATTVGIAAARRANEDPDYRRPL